MVIYTSPNTGMLSDKSAKLYNIYDVSYAKRLSSIARAWEARVKGEGRRREQ